jgi:predicted nucleic acid-binding protein
VDEPFGISVITVAELLHGVERANTEARKIKRQGGFDLTQVIMTMARSHR